MARPLARWPIAIGLLAIACTRGRPAPQPAAATPGLDCIPHGDTITLRGVIRVRPFGKGSDGVVLEVDDGTPWIASYTVTRQYRRLADRRVVAVGRACDKGGAAVIGRHLQIQRATPVDDDARCDPYASRDGRCLTRCDFHGAADDECAQGGWPLLCNPDGTCTPEAP